MNLTEIASAAVDELSEVEARQSVSDCGDCGDVCMIEDVSVDLAAHDRRFHGGKFNPKTMRCSLRKRLAKKDGTDNLSQDGMPKGVSVIVGDITKQNTDAIVNAANKYMLGGGGVDGAIHRAAGPSLVEECRQYPPDKDGYRLHTGEAKITGAGDLPCKKVIHTAGPDLGQIYGKDLDVDDELRTGKLLRASYRNSLNLAKKSGCKSIAFPSISTGIFGYPLEKAADCAASEIMKFKKENPNMKVKMCIFDPSEERTKEICKAYENAFKRENMKIVDQTEAQDEDDATIPTGANSENQTPPTDLQKHDAKYHPNGYKKGDSCKYRDNLEKGDKADVLDPENVEGERIDDNKEEQTSLIPPMPQGWIKTFTPGKLPTTGTFSARPLTPAESNVLTQLEWIYENATYGTGMKLDGGTTCANLAVYSWFSKEPVVGADFSHFMTQADADDVIAEMKKSPLAANLTFTPYDYATGNGFIVTGFESVAKPLSNPTAKSPQPQTTQVNQPTKTTPTVNQNQNAQALLAAVTTAQQAVTAAMAANPMDIGALSRTLNDFEKAYNEASGGASVSTLTKLMSGLKNHNGAMAQIYQRQISALKQKSTVLPKGYVTPQEMRNQAALALAMRLGANLVVPTATSTTAQPQSQPVSAPATSPSPATVPSAAPASQTTATPAAAPAQNPQTPPQFGPKPALDNDESSFPAAKDFKFSTYGSTGDWHGGSGGSTDPHWIVVNGQKYWVKKAGQNSSYSNDAAQNEVAANKFIRMAGLNAPESKLYTENGVNYCVTKDMPYSGTASHSNSSTAMREAYPLMSLLYSTDAMMNGNTKTDANGLVFLDNGSSFGFSAQGNRPNPNIKWDYDKRTDPDSTTNPKSGIMALLEHPGQHEWRNAYGNPTQDDVLKEAAKYDMGALVKEATKQGLLAHLPSKGVAALQQFADNLDNLSKKYKTNAASGQAQAPTAAPQQTAPASQPAAPSPAQVSARHTTQVPSATTASSPSSTSTGSTQSSGVQTNSTNRFTPNPSLVQGWIQSGVGGNTGPQIHGTWKNANGGNQQRNATAIMNALSALSWYSGIAGVNAVKTPVALSSISNALTSILKGSFVANNRGIGGVVTGANLPRKGIVALQKAFNAALNPNGIQMNVHNNGVVTFSAVHGPRKTPAATTQAPASPATAMSQRPPVSSTPQGPTPMSKPRKTYPHVTPGTQSITTAQSVAASAQPAQTQATPAPTPASTITNTNNLANGARAANAINQMAASNPKMAAMLSKLASKLGVASPAPTSNQTTGQTMQSTPVSQPANPATQSSSTTSSTSKTPAATPTAKYQNPGLKHLAAMMKAHPQYAATYQAVINKLLASGLS